MGKPVRQRGKWRIRWLDENGQRKSEVYDDYRVATSKLAQHLHEVDQIKRGLRAANPPAKTFGELCDYWIEKRAILKRSRKDDESIIRCHLRPFFGEMKLIQVGVETGDEFLVSRAHLDKKTISNIVTLLNSMLIAAKGLGWLLEAPRIRKPKVRLFSKDYRYLRTEEEIRRFLTAAREEGELVFVLYAMAVYTGLREGELAGLLWEDIDFQRRLIVVQRSFDGPTKAEDVRYVPILDPLLPILRNWRLRCPGRLVFPNRDGRGYGPSGRVFQEVLHRVLDAAGFPRREHKGRPRWYITFHGTRHTFASHWVMNSGDIFRLQKILGHKSITMTMRYAHLSPAAFKNDHARLGDWFPVEVAALLELPSSS